MLKRDFPNDIHFLDKNKLHTHLISSEWLINQKPYKYHRIIQMHELNAQLSHHKILYAAILNEKKN